MTGENDTSLRHRIAELERAVADMWGSASVAELDAGPRVTAELTDFGRAVQLVLGEMRRIVPFDSASVQELRGSRLVIVAGIGFADVDIVLGESFDIDNADTPNGEVVHRRRPLIVADTEQYRAFRRGLHVGVGIRSWLGVPMLHQERLVGMIAFDKAEANFYTADHQRIALEYGTVIASALTRAAQ